MKNYVRITLDEYGISPLEAHKRGMPYQSVYRQYRGTRKPTGDFAILYEKILGIPRWKIRPDLWPPAATPTTESESGARDG